MYVRCHPCFDLDIFGFSNEKFTYYSSFVAYYKVLTRMTTSIIIITTKCKLNVAWTFITKIIRITSNIKALNRWLKYKQSAVWSKLSLNLKNHIIRNGSWTENEVAGFLDLMGGCNPAGQSLIFTQPKLT